MEDKEIKEHLNEWKKYANLNIVEMYATEYVISTYPNGEPNAFVRAKQQGSERMWFVSSGGRNAMNKNDGIIESVQGNWEDFLYESPEKAREAFEKFYG